MGILDNLVPVAGRLLNTFGKTITLRTYAEVYNSTIGKNVRTPTSYAVAALVEDYPARDTKGGQAGSDGVVRGDRKVTIAAATLAEAGAPVPSVEMEAVIEGVTYSILKIDAQYATEEAALYTLQVRR